MEEAATSNCSNVLGIGNAARRSRVRALEASRAAISASTRVRGVTAAIGFDGRQSVKSGNAHGAVYIGNRRGLSAGLSRASRNCPGAVMKAAR